MALTIPDEVLEEACLSEHDAQIEIACRLFEAGKLQLWPAARWLGMTRLEFEEELRRRNIPIYRPTVEDLRKELAEMARLGK